MAINTEKIEDKDVIRKKQTGQSGFDGNEDLRTKQIKVTFSPKEFSKLVSYYNVSSTANVSCYCREKILAKPGRVVEMKELKKLFASDMYHLQKTSTNLNQIARKVNTLKSDYPELIEDLLYEIDEIKRIKTELLKKITR